MQRIDELPLHVLLHVLSLAYKDFSGVDVVARKTDVCGATLQRLATVSGAWNSAMQSVLALHRNATFSFVLESYCDKRDASAMDALTECSSLSTSFSDAKMEGKRESERVLPSLLATSVASFFSSIACKLHSQRAYPWGEDDTETAVASTDTYDEQKQSYDFDHGTEFESFTSDEIRRLRGILRTRSCTNLLELRLSDPVDAFSMESDRQKKVVLASQELQQEWNDMFTLCPNLQRLDLSNLPLLSPHLPSILIAASTQCSDVKVLVMPQQECLGYQRRNVKPAFEALYAALRNWHTSALDPASLHMKHRRRGLRRLVMPKLFAYEFYDEHMATIASFCPTLEYVEGLRLAPIFQARGLSHHQVMASWITAWDAFCRSCVHLREWNWFEIPFVDEFFAIFAAQPKLHITTLTLPGNTTLWKRDYVYQEHQEPANCVCTPSGMKSILHACPNLDTLHMLFSDRHLMFGTENPFLIGDDFLREVMQACPKIKRLRLTEAEARHGFEKTNSISDAGICALARLENLQFVELSGVAFTAKALFALATHETGSDMPRRCVHAKVGVRGVRKNDISTKFNTILCELLRLLLDKAATRGSERFPRFLLEVQIDTSNHQLPVNWGTPFRRNWMQMKHALSEKCPQLHFSYDLIHATATIRCQPTRPSTQ